MTHREKNPGYAPAEEAIMKGDWDEENIKYQSKITKYLPLHRQLKELIILVALNINTVFIRGLWIILLCNIIRDPILE